ncbi:hypothetical protein LINPERHAP1_LOCUS23334 [Linum perenne]
MPRMLITPQGISWLASQIGQPINKYVCDGLDIKICLIKNFSKAPVTSIEVLLLNDERCFIDVGCWVL